MYFWLLPQLITGGPGAHFNIIEENCLAFTQAHMIETFTMMEKHGSSGFASARVHAVIKAWEGITYQIL